MTDNAGKHSFGFIYGEKQGNLLFTLSELIKRHTTSPEMEFICFPLTEINFNTMQAFAAVITDGGIVQGTRPVPAIIYNFVYHTRLESIRAMHKLRTCEGITVINPVNRFNQSFIFQILQAFPQSDQFLLPFTTLNNVSLSEYMEKYDNLFLLPDRGLSQKNAIRVVRLPAGMASIHTGVHETICNMEELYATILKMTSGKRYMLVKGADMLLSNGIPLQARVYAQKNESGFWTISGSAAKTDVFSFGSIYGDMCEGLDTALSRLNPLLADESYKGVYDITSNLCSYLEYYLISIGSLTFDFIISKTGQPFVLQVRGFEQSFHAKALMDICYNNAVKYMAFIEKSEYMDSGPGEG